MSDTRKVGLFKAILTCISECLTLLYCSLSTIVTIPMGLEILFGFYVF